jgi:hypothetical protein
MLTFEYRVCPDVRAQGLGCDFLDVQSPCHPSVEDDTKIFDNIYKWDVPSIQLKVVPMHSMSFREADRLSLPIIDLYVPESETQVKVKVTLRLTVSQSVSLGVEPHVGLMTRYLLIFERLKSKLHCD